MARARCRRSHHTRLGRGAGLRCGLTVSVAATAAAFVVAFAGAADGALVMSNCSAAVTLTTACQNGTSEQDPFGPLLACVGSTGAWNDQESSCPRAPMALELRGQLYLDANGLGIERVIENRPGALLRADYIYLQDNRLSSLHIGDTARTKNLEELNLANNFFRSLESIYVAPGVQKLNMSGNPLGEVVLSDRLNTFEVLVVANASLTKMDLMRATGLLTLDASRNLLTSLDGVAFPNKLRKLDLGYNQVVDWRRVELPRSLRELKANDNGATTFIRANLGLHDKLTTIDLSNNKLEKITGMFWPRNLKNLDLRGNPIQTIEIGAADLPAFQALESFLVSSTAMACPTDATLETVANAVQVCVVPDKKISDEINATSSPRPSTASKGTTNTWLFILIGIVAAALIVVLLGVRHLRKKKKGVIGGSAAHESFLTDTAGTGQSASGQYLRALVDLRADPTLASLQITPSDIQVEQILRDGPSRTVALVRMGEYSAVMQRLHDLPSMDEHVVNAFIRAVHLDASLDHPKIVRLWGISWSTASDLAVLHEYMPHGHLGSLLVDERIRRTWFSWFTSAEGHPTKLSIAIDIVETLVYLHTCDPPVAHGQLTPWNVFFDATWVAKLHNVGRRQDARNDAPNSPAEDIAAFGQLLIELDTCGGMTSPPMSTPPETDDRRSSTISRQSSLQQASRDCPREILALATSCVDANPTLRPSAMKLHYELTQLRRQSLGGLR